MQSSARLLLLCLTCLSCAAPEPQNRLVADTQPPPAAAPVPAPIPKGASPVRVPLTVRETAGVGRAGEVVRSGVPLPRSLGVLDVRTLSVVDPAGRPVPADFAVLARWNAGKDDAAAPVQWLLVSFPATVPAGKSAVYSLVADGSAGPNPPPPVAVKLTRDGSRVTVDTGAAVFRLGGGEGALFDEISVGGRRLVTGSEMTLRTAGAAGRHAKVRKLRVEHAGPLSAVVVVDGAYDLPPLGKGGFGSRRRYVFTAGSPTAVVRHAVAWEGNLGCDGCSTTDKKTPNGALVEGTRDTLALDLGGASTVTAVGGFEAPALQGTVSAEAGTASVRQLLRSRRTAPLRFEVAVAGQKKEGEKADGGMLAVSGPAGSVAVALNHMHRYEPQALRLLADGRLAVDLVDDKAWLAHHQGLFATFAVTALPGKLERADLDRLLWAPLNRPLRAWPDAAWFTASEAVAEVPAGPLPKKLAAYDEVIPKVLNKTLRQVDSDGTAGLMTFGVYPRYWGEKGYPGEIECKDDPTPGEDWDHTFWCGAWTDYHNTVSTAAIWAMRSGDVTWLDEVAFPGALRTLHTQIMQCSPEERWFYCGQAPTGYGAYRTDFNSSHAYFENLFLYYWLTGDSMVVDVVERGGDSMRRLICGTRGPGPTTEPKGPGGPACAADRMPEGQGLTGRVGSQWIHAFRFLGLASDDPSFLEDYKSGLARALTWNYAELERSGRRYGFLGGEKPLKGPGTYEAGPWWTTGFYDAENLYRFKRDTGDAPIGDPAIPPSQTLAALARTVVEIGSRQFGDGTPAGNWPRLLVYTWTGPRIGGALTAVEAKDRELYNTEKAGALALLARAGRQTGDPALIEAGDDLIRFVLKTQAGDVPPLGKIQGQYLTRLHAAVAVAAEPPPPRR
ncbi:MAG TPA: hypothetical protein VLT87_30120 [Thermoanaerobaculia bacterium]|nr:hypothetical protein [Thermoanaerobaculia bacterium]